MKTTLRLTVDNDPFVVDAFDAPFANAPTVLLIHGWGGSGWYWGETVARLRHYYRLIVPDMLGYGRSLPVQRGRGMLQQVEAMELLLAHLDIERVAVIGHSMGGGVSMWLAGKRPDLVEKLVVTSISLFRNETERIFFKGLMEFTGVMMRTRAGFLAGNRWLARQMAGRYFYQKPGNEQILLDLYRDYMTMDYDTALACARSAADPAIHRAAERIPCSTLLIAGDRDPDAPEANFVYTQQVIPKAELRWIRECGHLPMLEHPDEYAALLRDFLNKPTTEEFSTRAVPESVSLLSESLEP
jgi:pimeloyl-ACP methyl ester carboxylesterase